MVPFFEKERLCQTSGTTSSVLSGLGMVQSPVPFFRLFFPPFLGLGNTRVTLYSLSKASEASKAFPFLPLKPLISLVAPDENSCPKCWSVSSLFRKRRKTSRPHSLLLHLATFGRIRIFPCPHLGHVIPPSAVSGRWTASISSVTCRV